MASQPFSLFRCLLLLVILAGNAAAQDDDHEIAAGPLFHEFKLTLDSGTRTEALGPFFYNEMKGTQHTWAIPPRFWYTHDPATESYEIDFLYPLMTYDRFGQQYRWQLGQLLNFAGGPTQTETYRDRCTLFPVYFQQRSSDPTQDYLAIGPFYGHMFNHLFRDEINYVMFPIFSQTRRKDVVTDNWLYPIGHVRHGDGLKGWQVLPFAGHEHKEITYQTNIWHEVNMVPGHDSTFIMWPLFENGHNGIGSDNPEWVQASMPLYNFLRSPKRDATTVLWPFFTWVADREKKYKEWEMPYPFVVIARGEGKHTTRFFPFVSWAHSATFESDFFLWPLYKYKSLHAPPADQQERRVVFYLDLDKVLRNSETGQSDRRITLWPLFMYHGNSMGTSGCRFWRSSKVSCLLLKAFLAITRRFIRSGVRKQIRARTKPANHCCGICIGGIPLRISKNARSCLDFSSMNPALKGSACACFIFRSARNTVRPKHKLVGLIFEPLTLNL